ncbi:hypothetical protein BJ742DRAFT_854154 [Cladochytrium replicatum]|nr:hypothetical protein BJ742DRAFT_854154 [Cladochytrium replicatum]
MEIVYPKLRSAVMSQFGLTFDIVDMRWGVLDSSTDNHATAELCLQELEACFEDSIGPALVCLAGDRYGYRPAPVVIKAQEFEEILAQIRDGERSFFSDANDKPGDRFYRLQDKDLLNESYHRNDNAVPSEYVFHPISYFYPGFKKTHSQAKHANDRFWHLETRLRKVLAQASSRSKTLSEEEKRKYVISVTEDEVMTGLRLQEKLRQKDPKAPSKVIVYSRTFDKLDVNQEKSKSRFSRFNDVCKDPEAEKLLRDMQKRLLAAVPKSQSTQFALLAPWRQGTDDGMGFNSHKDATAEAQEYIDKFCGQYYDVLWNLILEHVKYNMAKRRYHAADADIIEEVLRHRDILDTNYKNFSGRRDDLQKLAQFFKLENRKVIDEETEEGKQCGRLGVLIGKSGTGKTALISSAIVQEIEDKAKLVVVYRFVGTTRRSGTIRELLSSICLHIIRVYRDDKLLTEDMKQTVKEVKIRLESNKAYAFSELCQFFLDCLALPSATKRPLLLVIDNVDGLSNADDPLAFSWLPETPEEIPPDVKIMLVMDPYLEAMDRITREKYSEYMDTGVDVFRINDLNSNDVKSIINKYLGGVWVNPNKCCPPRKLQREQMDELLKHCNRTPRPLYLRMAIDVSRRLKSATDGSATDDLLKDNIHDMINALFASLEKSHGLVFVSHSLRAITAAEFGLSSSELEDLISCDDFVLNQVYEWWTPTIRRIPPLLWIRVRNALVPFLTEKGVDGVDVYAWHNREFETVARARYLCSPNPRGLSKCILLADDSGDSAITGTARGEVAWYQKGKPSDQRNLEHSSEVSSITCMEVDDEMWIVSGSLDSTVCLWNPKSTKVVTLHHDENCGGITSTFWAVSASNDMLLFSGTKEGRFFIWNFTSVTNGGSKPMQIIDISGSDIGKESDPVRRSIQATCMTGTQKNVSTITHGGVVCKINLYPSKPGGELSFEIRRVQIPFAYAMCPARHWEEAVFIGVIDKVLKYDFDQNALSSVIKSTTASQTSIANPTEDETKDEQDEGDDEPQDGQEEEEKELSMSIFGPVRALKLLADGRLCAVYSTERVSFIDLGKSEITELYSPVFVGGEIVSADVAWRGNFMVAGYSIPSLGHSGVIMSVFQDDGETKFTTFEATSEILRSTDHAIADLFIGKWANEPKPIDAPFSEKGDMGKSKDSSPKPRFVESHAPFRDEQKMFPDLRYITNAPKHLIRAGRLDEAATILSDTQFNAAANAAGSVYVRVVESHMKVLAAAYAVQSNEEEYKRWSLEQQDRAARAMELEEDPLAADLCIGSCAGSTAEGDKLYVFPSPEAGNLLTFVASSVYNTEFHLYVGMITVFEVDVQKRKVEKVKVIPDGMDDDWDSEDPEEVNMMPGLIKAVYVDEGQTFLYTFEEKKSTDGSIVGLLRKQSYKTQGTVAKIVLAAGEAVEMLQIEGLTTNVFEGKTVLVEKNEEAGDEPSWIWDLNTLEVLRQPRSGLYTSSKDEEADGDKDGEKNEGDCEEGEEEDKEVEDDDEEDEDESCLAVLSWDKLRLFAAFHDGRILIWKTAPEKSLEAEEDQEVEEDYSTVELLGQLRAHIEEVKCMEYSEVGSNRILLSLNSTDSNPNIPWVLKAFDVSRYWAAPN